MVFPAKRLEKLFAAGIRIFDNGGCGGTNFLAIEDQRDGKFDHQLDDWGISTAASLAEIVSPALAYTVSCFRRDSNCQPT